MLSPYSALSLCGFAIFVVGVNAAGRFLTIPYNATKCHNRPRHWQWPPPAPYQTYEYDEIHHYYFYSSDEMEFKDKQYDWLDARNLCRQYCMDAVSIETVREYEMIFQFFHQRGGSTTHFNYPRWHANLTCGSNMVETGLPAICNPASDEHCCNGEGLCKTDTYDWDCSCSNCIDYKNPIKYFWTSGRLCDFSGCEDRPDLLPLLVNGWFWSGSNVLIPATDTADPNWEFRPWSDTGHTGQPQPDNAEFEVNETPESCLAVSKDLYNDGIHWHDIACYHHKTVICEDSDELLDYIMNLNV